MVSIPSIPENAGSAAAGGAAGFAAGASKGLQQAAAAAGDVLRGIFGGLPWEMSAQSIVDAVTPGLVEVAGVLL